MRLEGAGALYFIHSLLRGRFLAEAIHFKKDISS
jgi:hypothetical protein